MSYVFNNTTTRQEILPGSPFIKSPRELVGDDERLVMSVIFPLKTEVSKYCLNCREGWNFANVGEVTWCVKQQQADQFLLGGFNANVYFCHSRCGLWVKIDDSYDGEADPITKLALDTIQASGEVQSSPEASQETRHVSGFRKLVEDFLSETKKAYPDDVSGDVTPEARRAIRARFPQLETPTLPKIPRWEFRRIRLCSPKWPEVSIPALLSRAKGLLEETVKGVNRLQELLSTCPDPPSYLEMHRRCYSRRGRGRLKYAEAGRASRFAGSPLRRHRRLGKSQLRPRSGRELRQQSLRHVEVGSLLLSQRAGSRDGSSGVEGLGDTLPGCPRKVHNIGNCLIGVKWRVSRRNCIKK